MESGSIPVNIVLGPEATKSIAATLQALRRAGLREETLLRSIGVIAGQVAADKLDALKRVPGVVVEPDETVRIPPPESSMQ